MKKLIPIVLFITGCAAPLQYRTDPTRPQEQWYADVAECQSKSWGTNGIFNRETQDYCMLGKGWRHVE